MLGFKVLLRNPEYKPLSHFLCSLKKWVIFIKSLQFLSLNQFKTLKKSLSLTKKRKMSIFNWKSSQRGHFNCLRKHVSISSVTWSKTWTKKGQKASLSVPVFEPTTSRLWSKCLTHYSTETFLFMYEANWLNKVWCVAGLGYWAVTPLQHGAQSASLDQ